MPKTIDAQTGPASSQNRWPWIFMVTGFVSAMIGLALYSVPLALVIGGTLLFVAGGLSAKKVETKA